MNTQTITSRARFALFACSSLVSTGVDQLVAGILFSLLRETFGEADFLRILLASIMARCVSMAVNYAINRRMVFGKDQEVAPCKRESLPRYVLLEAAILSLSSMGVWIAHIGFGILEWQAKPVVDLALFFLNYTGQRKWVFADREARKQVAVA